MQLNACLPERRESAHRKLAFTIAAYWLARQQEAVDGVLGSGSEAPDDTVAQREAISG
jgi:hypothetical protein